MYPSIAHGVDLELLCVCAHPLGWLMLTPYKGNHVHIVSARSSEQGAWRTVGTSPRSGSLACMAPGHSWGLFDDTRTRACGSRHHPCSESVVSDRTRLIKSGATSALKSSSCSRSGSRDYPVDACSASMADLRKHNQVQQMCRGPEVEHDSNDACEPTVLPPG